ncbi:MAG: hypothetical protein MUF61_00080 [archaeon]|nr:hypothetical protein [archaeon]
MTEDKKDAKEQRIRAITRLHYSKPNVIEAIAKFSRDREVVPRYFEGFGKRPDQIQYPSDIMGMVNRGATSFHASEELWLDPLKIDSNMTPEELSKIRKSWDLLIDVDSPFLDCSKIATKLIIAALEQHGVKNYGVKFSGSKGFHIIVPGKAFPRIFNGQETKNMFPEWARAISEYLMNWIRPTYNKEVAKLFSEEEILKRTNLKREDLKSTRCLQCNNAAQKGILVKLYCPECGFEAERRELKLNKRKLRCLNENCPGILEMRDSEEYSYCGYCKDPENEKIALSSDRHPDKFEETVGINAEVIANLDLVLVAPRHLFRMPYSLHEKTALASVVLKKEQIESFSPRDADPLKVKIADFLPNSIEGEAKGLLASALEWKRDFSAAEEKAITKKYANYQNSGNFEKIDSRNVTEDMFPKPIKKLLLGLKDGKKRGLFILITFLRSLNFPPDFINMRVREWNKKNEPPLKEGYIKSQIDWHLRQRKNILPPNYDNKSFYTDLGLLDGKPEVKNPIVEVTRKVRNRSYN